MTSPVGQTSQPIPLHKYCLNIQPLWVSAGEERGPHLHQVEIPAALPLQPVLPVSGGVLTARWTGVTIDQRIEIGVMADGSSDVRTRFA